MKTVSKLKKMSKDRLEAMRDVAQMSDETLRDLAVSRAELEGIVGARAGLPSQMLEMAARFGLDQSDIAQPRWRALEILDTCRHCEHSKACFDFLIGSRDQDFSEMQCPNAERYTETALEGASTR